MAERVHIPWFRRLYLRIYLSVLAIMALLVLMWSLAEYSHSDPHEYDPTQLLLATAVVEALPPVTASGVEQQAVLQRWQSTLQSDLVLYAANGDLQAVAGQQPWISNVPALGVLRLGAKPPDYPLPLSDGRWLLVHQRGHTHMQPVRMIGFSSLIVLTIGLGCYVIARRLTRRLEHLQRSVTAWGSGALSARVEVEGQDEVAALARSFNHSVERIESLVDSQKALLSNASHELRSPLARLRMAVELLPAPIADSLRAEFARNIVELNQLVEEILLASRLDAHNDAPIVGQELDLADLARDECAAVGASLQAGPTPLRGDAVLLRRLLRNLLENACRHGGGREVQVRITTHGDCVELTVSDHGPGISEDQRERVFEPFYRLPGASESDGGVGLGLSLVRQIAKAHRGIALCVDPEAAGACFRVRLPRRRETTSP